MMTAEQLKASILQMAMQGKLVEQRKKEESVCLKQVKAKKTDDLEFDIPEKWITAHIENITESVASKQYQIKESEVKTSGKHMVISQSQEYSIGFSDDTNKLYHHDAPVIVFGDHTTVVKIVDFDFIVGADGVKIFAPDLDVLYPRFFFLEMQYYTRGLNKVGGYSRHYKFIKDKPFVVPPLEEQKRIVAKIEELMPFVKQYAKASIRLNALNDSFPKQMKKSILQQAVIGKLVPQDPYDEPASVLLKKIAEEKQKLIKEGKIKKQKALPAITEDEIPFDIPESWKWVRLNEIIENVPANGFSPKGVDYQTDYKNLTLTATTSGTFKTDAFKYVDITKEQAEKYFLKEDDILIQRSNSRELVGTACLYTEESNKYIYPDLMMRIHALDGIWSQYLVMTLQSPYVREYYQQNASGSSQSMPKINQSIVGNTLIPIPPLHEQKKIVQTVNRLIPTLSSLCQ